MNDYEIDQFQEDFEAAARAHIFHHAHELPSPWPAVFEDHEEDIQFDFGTAYEEADDGSEENHWAQVFGTVELRYSKVGEALSIRLELSGNANTGTPERNVNIDTMEEARPQDPH